jgi:hypothetical protein
MSATSPTIPRELTAQQIKEAVHIIEGLARAMRVQEGHGGLTREQINWGLVVVQKLSRMVRLQEHYDHKKQRVAKIAVAMAKWPHETRTDWVIVNRRQLEDLFHTARCSLIDAEGQEQLEISAREFNEQLHKLHDET